MKPFAFYPGCALQAMNWDYRESIRTIGAALDLQLRELPDWTCCGATAAHSLDERMAVILPAWNLAGAEALGLDLAVACPMCFKRVSLSRKMLRERKMSDPWGLTLEGRIFDLARWLSSEPMLARIRERARVSLEGLKVVCYYGCQVVRPPKITGYEDYENPRHLDRLAAALGATAVDWSYKATCCGAGIGIARRDIAASLVGKLLFNARASGAQAIVVCCPLCQSNLDLQQPELCRRHGWDWQLPVFYYTELLGMAIDPENIRACLRGHLVDPAPLLAKLGGT
jgi:heterodisulfide reductase subunit B